MKRLLSIILLLAGAVPFAYSQSMFSAGEAFVRQLTPRDSILIADQLEYGFELDSVKKGTVLALQDFAEVSNDTLTLVRNWRIDTLEVHTPRGRRAAKAGTDTLFDIKAGIIIAPFEEGRYDLPEIAVKRTRDGVDDTLLFAARQIEVKTIPVDTATFVIHDIKGQARYPLTVRDILPYLGGLILIALLAVLTVRLIERRRRNAPDAPKYQEPAYIIALRALDRFRGEGFWAPEKQKAMYSGITDALRTYMEDRFGINAEEMTTREIFSALKDCSDLPQDIYASTRELFELSDFVKFAKHVASAEENAHAVPTAVRFVTTTYQSQLDAQASIDGGEAAGE